MKKRLLLLIGVCLGLTSCNKEVLPEMELNIKTSANAQQQIQILGKVIDYDTNVPISGAQVLVLGTPYGSLTDLDGKFVLNGDFLNKTLEIGDIGYKTVEYKIVPPGSSTVLSLVIKLQLQDE